MLEPFENLQNKMNLAQIATQAAEDKFSLLVDSVKDYAIFLLDPDGNILSWNKGAERIKGYSADEVIGKNFSIFYTMDDIKRHHPQNELRIALAEDRYEEEGWRIRKNGTTFWANIVITPLRDKSGNHVGFAKVTRDLTERKEAEERLKKSEERHRRMFEGIKDYSMIMLDENGYINSWNEGARRIQGYEAHEILGQYFCIFYPDLDVQMGKCEYELNEARETGHFEDEGWRIRKDGTKFWASVLITAIRDEKGSILGFTKVTRDITDKKRANDLLKMAYANLEKRVEERTNELMKLNKELEDAVKIRDEFLTIASHELRTPLTPLKLQIQTLVANVKRNNLVKMPEERLMRMAETSERALNRLTMLIDDLLDVSRISTGKLKLHLESFDIVHAADEIIQRHRYEIEKNHIKVSLEARQSVIGNFDKLRIEQMFYNLLSNALTYGNNNPVTIRISAERGTARIEVVDRGVGIKDIDKERIFNRFEKVHSPLTTGGLGLGLYFTKQIVEAHHGTLEVKSAPGKGSIFTVCLPLNQVTTI